MRWFIRSVSFACLALLFLAASAIHAEEHVKTVATERLGQLLSTMAEKKGFSCQFRQFVFFAEGGEQSYSGALAIRRPGHFRWQYTLPYEQLYISDGGVIWHYEPDLMQAQRMKNLDAVDPVAMKLLDGRIGIKDIKLLATEKLGAGNVSYRIKIDNGPELVLAFSTVGELHWLESEDMLGNRNRIILFEMINKTPPDGLFQFVPPEGVEVVDIAGAGDGSEQGY